MPISDDIKMDSSPYHRIPISSGKQIYIKLMIVPGDRDMFTLWGIKIRGSNRSSLGAKFKVVAFNGFLKAV